MQCEVVDRLYAAMDSIARRERVPRSLGGPELLHRADIQYLDAVAGRPGISATALAEALGVTRGAVTQWGNRLEALGLIARLPVQSNRKTKQIRLTPRGEAVRAARARAHRAGNERMCGYLRGLQPEQLEAVTGFLELAETLDISPFECLACGCAAPESGASQA